MGTGVPPSLASQSRIASVAWRPSMPGICTSMNTRSKRSCCTASTAA